MNKLIKNKIILLLFSLWDFVASQNNCSDLDVGDIKVLCYYDGRQQVDNIYVCGCTHVIYTGKIRMHILEEPAKKILRKQPNAKIILRVSGKEKVLNLIILILYRTGYAGQLLGVGGTWNLNEEKNPDAEIVASGVFVGYFIYTSVQLVGFCFGTTEHKRQLTDVIMNFIGIFLWIAVGGTALHYWHGYQGEHHYKHVYTERQVGLALGSLCIFQGALYLLDTVLSLIHYSKEV